MSLLSAPLAATTAVEIVVSIPPLAEMVERVGGDGVRVTTVLPAGAAPESWAPTPGDALAVARADLYVGVGHPALAMEKRYLEPLAGQAAGVDRIVLLSDLGDIPASDPHLWMDLDLLASTAVRLAGWLRQRQPERSTAIDAAISAYLEDLERVGEEVRSLLEGPHDRPVLLQHPAWERLLEHYGVAVLVIEDDGRAPGAASLSRLIGEARVAGIQTVFTQTGVSNRGAELVAVEIGGEVRDLDPLARDWLLTLVGAARQFSRAAEAP